VLEREERDAVFARAVETDPGWAGYQAKTERVIPVVALYEIAQGGPPDIAAATPGEAIRLVHDGFRRELALIKEEMTGGGSALGAQLRVNCLTLCRGIGNHHAGEDAGLFPFLAGRHPELAPVLERLRGEHERVAELVGELRRAVSGERADAAAARAEVERLAGELEAHLEYEERELVPLLDG
jgi:hypothetical protein